MSTFGPNVNSELTMIDREAAETEPQDVVEVQVQRILSDLEQSAPEVQLAVFNRLLGALAAKLPASLPPKIIGAAKENQVSAKPKATSTKARSNNKSKSEEFARIDSQLALLSDSTDPMEAWLRFGQNAQSLREVLRYEPTGALEGMLRHNNMPPGTKPRGKSRDALVEAIVSRLDAHFSQIRIDSHQ